jgi:hypothetical protein
MDAADYSSGQAISDVEEERTDVLEHGSTYDLVTGQ